MDIQTFQLVERYRQTCHPKPSTHLILMAIAYATKSSIDISECVYRGDKKNIKKSLPYDKCFLYDSRDRIGDKLKIIFDTLNYEEKLSRKKLADLTGLKAVTISKHRKQMLTEGLINSDWSINCDGLQSAINKKSQQAKTYCGEWAVRYDPKTMTKEIICESEQNEQ